MRGTRRRARRRSSPRPRSTRPSLADAPVATSLPSPASLLLVALLLGCTVSPRAAATARRPESGERSGDHHGHPERGDRQDPVGAELPPRAPPPHRRADDDGRRQGRQRRAGAQVARPAGDRDRASRAARPGTRIVEQLTEESILNDFVRIREESRTNTAVLDPTTGEQTEINERGPAVTRQGARALPRQARLPGAQGAEIVVFAGSLPRGVDPDYLRELIRELRKLDVTTIVDTDGEPLRHAVRAEPTVISPNVNEAEELVGHEFNDDEDMVHGRPRDGARSAPREAIMTDARRLLRLACRPTARRRRCCARGSSRASRSRPSARATRSWPASSPRATAARSPEECLRFGVACGAESTQRLGAGLIDPREVERLRRRGRGRARHGGGRRLDRFPQTCGKSVDSPLLP